MLSSSPLKQLSQQFKSCNNVKNQTYRSRADAEIGGKDRNINNYRD